MAEPDPWMPWRDPDDPAIHRLDPTDPGLEGWNARRDTSTDPKREAGLVNPQRYEAGLLALGGFPTFFGAPMAFNTEDLRAGNVDVALVGMTVENTIVHGARFAANAMRTLRDWMSYGGSDTDQFVRTQYLKELQLADYGNVASHYTLPERSTEEIRKVYNEVIAGGAIPMGVGGTHVQQYGTLMALADQYGPGNVAMLHFDAHYDAYTSVYGVYVHSGSMMRVGVEKGIIKGEDIITVGLRAVGPPDYDLAWIREHNLRYHTMAEIIRDGWDTVMKRIYREIEGKKVFISFDIDCVDPAYAAAVGTQDPGGLTSNQVIGILRGLAMQNDVVAIEFCEYNPFMDDQHQTTGVLMDRLMRSFLAGLAARKQGITDPDWIHPDALDHGHRHN